MSKIVIFIMLLTTTVFSQEWFGKLNETQKNDFRTIQNSFNEHWLGKEYEKGSGIKQFKRWEHFWEQRLYPDYQFPNAKTLYENYNEFKNNPSKHSMLSLGANWEEVGPVNVPENWLNYESSGLGRLNVVKTHPDNNNVIWVGAASGGLWKSTNKGESWRKIEIPGLLMLGISDLDFAHSDPSVMYAATGDKNGSWMTNGYSVGVIKSTDSGESWFMTGLSHDIPQQQIVYNVIVDPEDPNLVYAGAGNGIYKTTDGGNNWNRVHQGGPVRDLEFKPNVSGTIYASTNSQILRSTDAGNSWSIIQSYSGTNRIEIAVTKANPDYIYSVSASTTGGLRYITRSVDAGESWTVEANSPNLLGHDVNGGGTNGQGYYDLTICVSTFDPNEVYVGGVHIWKSINGGANWSIVNHWTGSFNLPFVHADQHYLWMNPNTLDLYSANDGGLYISSNRGTTWRDISNGLAIAQFYRFANSEVDPNLIVGGTQDNGTHMYNEGEWFHINGADGMEAMIDFEDADIIYSTIQYGTLRRSTNRGRTFSVILQGGQGTSGWVTPLAMDYENTEVIYVGRRDLLRSTNSGTNWNNLNIGTAANMNDFIGDIALSPSNSNYIYFSKRNRLFKSTNGGNSFSQAYTGSNTITDIKVSRDNPELLWITQSGYNTNNRVVEIRNGNATDISENLPGYPANAIEHLETEPGTLFVGTDIGVFVKNPSQNEWIEFSNKLPAVVVNELEMNYASGMLRAATFARGIWQTKIVECDIERPTIAASIGQVEFCQGDSVLLSATDGYVGYLWSNGKKDREIWVKDMGTYYVTTMNELGCKSISESIEVNVDPVPNLSIIPENNGYLCEGETMFIAASFGYSKYEWSTGEQLRRITIDKGGKYSVTGFTSKGCKKTTEVEVIEAPNPDVPVIEKDGNVLSTKGASGYQWYFNGNTIGGANNRLYEATESGQYTVEIYNQFGCSAISEPIDIITSVESIEIANHISVMPNPNEGVFTLQFNNLTGDRLSITISDIFGQEVIISEDIKEYGLNVRTYDINNLPNGTYFLRIQNDGFVHTEKIIKMSK